MTLVIPNTNQDVSTLNTNLNASLSLQVNDSGEIDLVATLAHAILSFNFTLAGVPVITGITGSLDVKAQYKEGPIVNITTVDLSNTNSYKVVGKYTKLILTLNSLTGADTVIIYADQNVNIINVTGGGGGAVSSVFGRTGAVVAQSGDYTIAQITNGLSDVLTSGQIFVGNVSNLASGVTASGDVTISNLGVTTISTNSVTNTKLSTMPALTIKGNNTGSVGNAKDLTVAEAKALLAIPSIATQSQTDNGYSSQLAVGVAQLKIYDSENKFIPTVWEPLNSSL